MVFSSMVFSKGRVLSDSDIQKYREDGLLIVRNFFDQEDVERILQGWQNLLDLLTADCSESQRNGLFISDPIPEETLWNLYKHEALVENVRRILGSTDIALYTNRIMLKDENWHEAIHVHQDMSFWHGGVNKVSIFVPLQPHNETVGGLKLLKGSHKYGNLGIPGTIHPDQFSQEFEVVPLVLEVGDVAFMDVSTWHFSVKATVPSKRPLQQITYQPASDCSYMLSQPVLVCGQWQTSLRNRLQHGITPSPYPQARPKNELELEVEELQSKVQYFQETLNQTQTELEQSRGEANRLNASLSHAVNRIQAIETSKFWQLRKGWFKLKRAVGLGANE